MAIPLVVNGVTFNYPQQFDRNWGPTLTNWSSAITSGMLQTSGVNAASFVKSSTVNPASGGFLRLAKTDSLVWRNNLNNGDLALSIDGSNQLTFNGVPIGASASLTDGHIYVGNVSNNPADVAMTGDITITNAGVTAIGSGKVLNANVGASAAIALSKLASTSPYYWYAADSGGVLSPLGVTASKAVVSDANGLPSASSVTSTELGHVSGVTSAIQTQLDARLPLVGGTMSGPINMAGQKIVSIANGTASGDAINFSQWNPFRILQMQYAEFALLTAGTNSTTFVKTGTKLSFTPISNTSKVLIMVQGTLSILECVDLNSSGEATLFRDSTNLFAFSGSDRAFRIINQIVPSNSPTPGNLGELYNQINMFKLETSPGAGVAVEYSVQIKYDLGQTYGEVAWCPTGGGTGTPSSILIVEIAN